MNQRQLDYIVYICCGFGAVYFIGQGIGAKDIADILVGALTALGPVFTALRKKDG